MGKPLFDSITIPHQQTDDSLATFFCVRRMPNGKLATARCAVPVEYLDECRLESRKTAALIILGELCEGFKSLQKRDDNLSR